MINEREYRLIAGFLKEYWCDFDHYAEKEGFEENEVEELINKLEGKAND